MVPGFACETHPPLNTMTRACHLARQAIELGAVARQLLGRLQLAADRVTAYVRFTLVRHHFPCEPPMEPSDGG